MIKEFANSYWICVSICLYLAVEVEIVQIEIVCKDRPDGNIHLDFTVRHKRIIADR